MKNKLSYIFVIMIFALFAIIARAQTSPDAIAIRIMQNPNHYSALRWYQEKHFSGSPQSIIVDGYNGIRDGRTVYVNAANVVNGKLYTNIYLISYNQSAENATVDIFGKMVSHWKFNANITNPDEKAKIVRDTIRLEGLNDVKYLLTQYKAANGHYPELNAGSYIKNVSVSTWPSWQEVLAKELKTKLPEDATNKLGACPANFNPKTCWDEKERKFADTNPSDSQINLPENSSAFVYQTDSKGAAYDLCATMESGYIQGTGSGSCSGTTGGASNSNYQVTESKDNHAPKFSGFTLPTINSGLNFVGYIKAVDSDDDDIIWTFNFQPDFAQANQWASWSDGIAPIVSNSPNKNEKKIAASKTGKKGSYVFTANISDGRASTTQVFTINVVNDGPVFTLSDHEYIASTTNPFQTAFEIYDLVSDYPLGYTLSYAMTNWVLPVVTFGQIDPSNPESRYKFSFSGILATSSNNIAGNYLFSFDIKDKYEETISKNFNLKVINNSPIITTPLDCQQITRQGNPYQSCQIQATDPDGNLITNFQLTQSALGVSIDSNGLIQGNPSAVGIFPIIVIATDEYGAISQPASYDLHVNNYCGDGTKQGQNTEGKGGAIDNGQEQCDGTDNVALTPSESSQNKQYACSASCTDRLASCAGACVFTGGWCGDGVLQDGTAGTIDREECDASIDDAGKKCEALSTYGVKDSDGSSLDCLNIGVNIIGLNGVNSLYDSMCDPSTCQFPVVGSECYNSKTILGQGCYLGQASPDDAPPTSSCQKGVWSCVSADVACDDIFAEPIYDYCCIGNDDELKDGNVAGKQFSVVKVVQGVGVSSNSQVYTEGNFYCDNICQKVGKVCVGVGLESVSTDSCVYIVDNMWNNGLLDCGYSANQATNDCRKDNYSPYLNDGFCSLDLDGDYLGDSSYSSQGTSCYCL